VPGAWSGCEGAYTSGMAKSGAGPVLRSWPSPAWLGMPIGTSIGVPIGFSPPPWVGSPAAVSGPPSAGESGPPPPPDAAGGAPPAPPASAGRTSAGAVWACCASSLPRLPFFAGLWLMARSRACVVVGRPGAGRAPVARRCRAPVSRAGAMR
jgi:hypothetical protein